jgi:hypothetical protein
VPAVIGAAASRAGTCGDAADLVTGCALMRRGGFDVLTGLVDAPTLSALRAEADAILPDARESLVTDPVEAERGGMPSRKFLSAPGGPLQTALLAAPWLHALLGGIIGLRVRPTGAGTFTWYCRPGDHLALHRDIRRCDVAVITALRAERTGEGEAGGLALYPDGVARPLATIRARPRDGRLVVHLAPGETAVLLGGLVPHALLPTAEGQRRIVSVACFEAAQTHCRPSGPQLSVST